MFTREERENMKRMIFNNKDNTRDIGRKKMTGERAREAKVIKFPRDLGFSPGIWAWGLGKLRGAYQSQQQPNAQWTIGVNEVAADAFLEEEWWNDSHRKIL